MNGLVALTVLIALLIWLAAAEWTINGIERDPVLWERWYALPRALRAVLVLIAWPLLAVAVVGVLMRANRHV
jgi:hypothetical protein